MDAVVKNLAAEQDDLVAVWQLVATGATPKRIEHLTKEWRRIHRGVYLLTQSPITQRQRWIAATLIAPHVTLSHASAGACWNFRPRSGSFETVTRSGNGGTRRSPGLLVFRSTTLGPEVTKREGIRITTGARTLLDLAPHLDDKQLGRAFREALRLNATNAQELHSTLTRSRGRRGARRLWELTDRYAALPYRRTRSNAEARAIEILANAGNDPELVNRRVAGEEADLIWPSRRLIIEIDGPGFHRFADEDARKQRAWEGAGWTVRRIPSDDVYARPERLLALARA